MQAQSAFGVGFEMRAFWNIVAGPLVLVRGDSKEVEYVLLVRSGHCELIKFGAELRDANAVAAEC